MLKGFQGRIERNPWPLIISCAALLIAACSTLPTQTFAQKYDDAVALDTLVLGAATASRQSGFITGQDEANIINYVVNSKAILDEAQKLEATDPTGAAGKLNLASAVLRDAQTYLATHKTVKAP